MVIKNIVVIGATGTIAKYLLKNLAKDKFNLILISKNEFKLNDLKSNLLSKFDVKIDTFAIDLEDHNSADIIVKYLKDKLSEINSIIFLARNTEHLFDDKKTFSRQLFNSELNLSLSFPVEFSLKIANVFKYNLKSIIFTSSIYGLVTPNENLYLEDGFTPVSYSSSRSAIIQASRHLAKRLAPFTIVNTIVLGGVFNGQRDEFIEKYKSICPSKKMINEEDISHPFLYFINAPSSNFTGTILTLDGGWTL